MARNTVRLEGLPELLRDLKRAAQAARVGLGQAVREAADAIAADTQAHAPVLSGGLRRDVAVEIEGGGLAASVGYADDNDAVTYGAQVEFGTSDTPAQPALGPAAERERSQFPGRATQAVRRQLG